MIESKMEQRKSDIKVQESMRNIKLSLPNLQ